MKKRIGNDFKFPWRLTQNSNLIDVNTVIDFAIVIKHSSLSYVITPPFTIVDGSPLVECSKLTQLGKYSLIDTWKVPDSSCSDGFRDCAADVDTFEMVARSSEEDNEGRTITSEVLYSKNGPLNF